MSFSTDVERSEAEVERAIEDAKQVMRDLQAVLAAFVDNEKVSVTAKRLKMSRPRVHYLQRVLKVRSGRLKSGYLCTREGVRGSELSRGA